MSRSISYAQDTAPSTVSNSLRNESLRQSTTPQNNTLLSARIFECYSPPPVNTLRGVLIPRALSKRRRRRKIVIEVHKVASNPLVADLEHYVEECIVRILDPVSHDERRESFRRAKLRRMDVTGGQSASVTLLNEHDNGVMDDDYDDGSWMGVPAECFDMASHSPSLTVRNYDTGWVAKYKFPIRAIEIKGTYKTGVVVQISIGKLKQIRELIFDSMADSDSFLDAIRDELSKEAERAKAKMFASLGSTPVGIDDQLVFLIEVVSAWDIPVGDLFSSDPYVVCMLGGKKIHKTKYIPKTRDPVWTIDTDSLFLLKVSAKNLFLNDGIVFLLNDYDKVGKNEILGAVRVSAKQVFEAVGERIEFKLGPAGGKVEEVSGFMAIRCRRASQEDIDFVDEYYKSEKQNSLMSKFHQSKKEPSIAEGITGASSLKSFVTKRTRIARDGPSIGKKQYKMRPNPDPDKPSETTWMTKKEIEAETVKESRNWVDAGTGSLGRLFVEILGCDDLPNMDTGGFAGNKTDAFISLVYEDIAVRTDVIDDCLSPRWPPWSQRAFIFHILHSSSQLFLGVFDYDVGFNPTDDHDPIGRVSVDLSNLRKNTLYVLKYHLYTSARVTKRKRNGSITIRLRLEIPDERKMLLSSLEPPPPMYVNTKSSRDLRVVRITCTGKHDMEKYSMKTINSYIEELLSIQHVLYYLHDSAMSLLLWRGTLPVPFESGDFMFPIHSLSAFMLGIAVVENPELIPSAVFSCLAWIMIASNGYRRSLPDVWSRCKSFDEFVEVLFLGTSRYYPDNIAAFENFEEAEAFLEKWRKRIAASEEAARKAYKQSVEQQLEIVKDIDEIGENNIDITTKDGGVSMDPFKPILFPVQQHLAKACRYLRHIRFIIAWEECYISFWVTIGFLLLSLFCFFIPWFYLMKWTFRCVVWLFLGPWMKLVDIYYVQKIKPRTEEEIERRKHADREKRSLRVSARAAAARIKRENAFKLKAMKQYMFGKYVIRVPILKEDRYRDNPLPDSYAVPYKLNPLPLSELALEEALYKKTRLPGQHLAGNMVPMVETRACVDAPTVQAMAYPSSVTRDSVVTMDTTKQVRIAARYSRVGSALAASAVIAWVLYPLLGGLIESIIDTVSLP